MSGIQAGRLNIEIVAEIARLQADLDKAKRAVKGASDDIARSAKAANDNLAGMSGGIAKAGSSSRLAGHHVQNLAFQFQDLGVQLASGAKPLTAFVQQGSQIGGVMMQAGIGVRGLIVELLALAAPFAPIILAAGLLAGGIALITDEINQNSKVHVTWSDTLLGIYDVIKGYLNDQLTSAFAYFGTTTQQVWRNIVEFTKAAVNNIIANAIAVPKAIYDSWSLIPAGVADIFLSAANRAIDAVNGLIRKSIDGINGFIREANTILDQFGLGIAPLSAPQISKLENSYAGAGAKLGGAMVKSLKTTFQTDFIGGAADMFGAAAVNRALQREAEKAGKDAGSKLGKSAAKAAKEAFDFEAANLKLVNKAAADAAAEAAKNSDAEWKAFRETLKNWAKYEADEAAIKAQQLADRLEASNDQLRDMIGLLGRLGGFGEVLGGLLGIVSGNTSAVGGIFGDLLNIGIGTTTDKDGKVVARTIGDEISKIFKQDGDFAKTFGSLLQGAGTGLAFSSALGLADGTGGKLGSAIGGALGEKLGEKFLSKGLESIAKGLGDFAGPLGAIAGGLLGSVLGGLFTSVKWGRVDLSSAGVSGTSGNNSASERAALAAGNSIFGALGDIADALGGSVGDFGNISVGVRHGDYRVNTGGTSLKVKKGAVDFNDDAEAAISYAIQQAIDRGAIRGVDAATQRLLKSSDDLQANLEKALKFQSVFDELESITDPLGYAIDSLTEEFDKLKKLFDEAGASADQYAKLEELLTLKRQEAIDGAMREMVDKYSEQNSLEVRYLELLGKSEEALSLQRMAELAATKQALQPMQSLIYQLEDFNKTIETFGPLADDLRAFKKELLGGGSTTSFASLAATFRDTASAASMGDAGALGKLRGVSQEYLDAAMANAGSAVEYQRALGQVLNAVDQGIFAADTQVDYAQAQIDAINANYDVLTGMRDELKTYNLAIVENLTSMNRLWSRFEALGFTVRTDDDTPIQVEVVS